MANPKSKTDKAEDHDAKAHQGDKTPQEKSEKETKDTKELKAEKEQKDTKVEKTEKAEKCEKAEAKANSVKCTSEAEACDCQQPMKGFFARKYDENENIVTIFKAKKIWGALIGEMMGTLLLAMLFLMLGAVQSSPLTLWIPVVAIYAVIVGLSGAHLNPLVTAGAMATRRVSAIRGVLYMLAQLLGAWVALIIVNAFRLNSGTSLEMPVIPEITGETFWQAGIVELIGAIIIGFCFARTWKFAKKQPLAFAGVMAGATVFVMILGAVVASSFFETGNSFMFNPVLALMYQILPTAAEGFGELAAIAGMALAAYVLMPVVGGILGFLVADTATRLAGESCCSKSCGCGAECSCKK